MAKVKFGLVVIFSLLLLSSCFTYTPQTVDVPLISKKNDLRIDGGISFMPSLYTTVSYGLTDKISVQAFGSIANTENYYLQGAVGYYKNLSGNRIMEIYGGFGYSITYIPDNVEGGSLFGNYQQYFVQFNYGKINCKFANTDFGFGIKTGYIRSELTNDNYYDPFPHVDYMNQGTPYPILYDDNFLFSPGVFVRLGGENLKFSLKLNTSWIYKFTNTEYIISYIPFTLGVGLNYKF